MQELKDVVLHVYSLQTPAEQQQQMDSTAGGRAASFFSRMLPQIGMGAYHTSLEVMDDRYTFAANAGIVKTRSNREGIPPGASYKEVIPLGACSVKNRGEVQEIIQKLSSNFGPNSYHLVHRNCNHFTETLATALILQDNLSEPNSILKRLKTYPEWVNRLANTGRMVVSHDSDIVPCNVLLEAGKAVGADEKVGWDFKAGNDNKRTTTQSKIKGGKKELTEAQKAALANIRRNKK